MSEPKKYHYITMSPDGTIEKIELLTQLELVQRRLLRSFQDQFRNAWGF